MEDKQHAEFFIKLRALLREYDMQINSESLDHGVRVHSRTAIGRRVDYTTHSLHEHMQEIAERRLVEIGLLEEALNE